MTDLPSLGPRGEGWVAIQLGLLALVALSGVPSDGAFSSVVTTVAGFVLMAAGAYVLGRGIIDLGGSLTPLPRPRSDARFVDTGLYAHVRHPMYAGLVLTAFGWALVVMSPITFVLAVVLLGFFVLKSMREEDWLVERYHGYRKYQARTRRIVPWLF